MKFLWMTDLHLDRASSTTRKRFFNTLASTPFDAAMITGDISNADGVCSDLLELGGACGERKVYFVLGNHDFYGSSFGEVDKDQYRLSSKY